MERGMNAALRPLTKPSTKPVTVIHRNSVIPRAVRSQKTARIFRLREQSRFCGEFSHTLGGKPLIAVNTDNKEKGRLAAASPSVDG